MTRPKAASRGGRRSLWAGAQLLPATHHCPVGRRPRSSGPRPTCRPHVSLSIPTPGPGPYPTQGSDRVQSRNSKPAVTALASPPIPSIWHSSEHHWHYTNISSSLWCIAVWCRAAGYLVTVPVWVAMTGEAGMGEEWLRCEASTPLSPSVPCHSRRAPVDRCPASATARWMEMEPPCSAVHTGTQRLWITTQPDPIS